MAKKRRLRPEDERALNILAEKFRHTDQGVVCQVTNCSAPLTCIKPSNLKRHLCKMHPKLYNHLFPNEVSSKKRAELETFNAELDAVELVTVNGYPFLMLDASGMRGYIQSRQLNVRSEGFNISVSRHDIVKKVAAECDLIRHRIKSELKGKTVSVMFDICTIATLSMIGVDVMFMDDGKVDSITWHNQNRRTTYSSAACQLFVRHFFRVWDSLSKRFLYYE